MDSFFSEYLIDVSIADEATIVDALDKYGVVTFNDVFEINYFLSICGKIGIIFNHPDADSNGITQIKNKTEKINRPGVPGFTEKNLTPHTDRATVPKPPFYTCLLCIKAGARGGESILVDGKKVYNDMKNHFPKELSLLEKPDIAIFGKGNNQHSSSVFNSTDSLNKYIRFRYDDVAYFSAEVIGALNVFLELVYKNQHIFKLDCGQGYIAQNGRWLHGRNSFEGERLMYRVLIDSRSGTTNFGFNANS